ncbi:protein FAR1-RELATED SEQUENCE 1-like [Chenopodium quinoa]|uniref:protein FAR1-RELATED SEQUENCE 1-like n=1 Tax=Chenopodium quinoa TaxID=63459 RepID=UPI000B780517|nr:protein FAR1-RELATED SEQUENCE 1-like [Chenopodium quinoa]
MMYVYDRGERVISDNIIEYTLEDRVWLVPPGKSEEVITDRHRYYCVTFNTETTEVCCNCRKIETHGIMCKHTISILDRNFVLDVPERYIVSRWQKDIMRKHTRVKVTADDPSEVVHVKRFNMLLKVAEPLCEEAAMVNDETVQMVIDSINQLRLDVDKCRKTKLEQTIALNFPNDFQGSASAGFSGTTLAVQKPTHVENVKEIGATVKDPVPPKKPRGTK